MSAIPNAASAAPARAAGLRHFVATALGEAPLVEPASADASFRSYWRATLADGSTRVVMDAPPAKEDLGPWLDVATRLHAAGLHAPAVLAVDRAQGFVLMEDLGTRTFLPELDADSVDDLYGEALAALLRMQAEVPVAGLPPYDRRRLVDELELMPEWFLKRHLGFQPSCEQWDVIEAAFTLLIGAALEQPRAFVHRDFHSRNLLVVRDSDCEGRMPKQTAKPARGARRGRGESMGNRESEDRLLASPGIIDFQDAVAGPVTYDLVSLLRDCYIQWPAARVAAWAEGHRLRLVDAGLIGADVDAARFARWFDLMGLQRHLKVLGIFCRLWYRDGKAQYLGDLPLVWHYTFDIAGRYPELADFVALLQHARANRDLRESRAETTA